MEFKHDDFKGLMYPVNKIPDTAEFKKVFPDLMIYPEFKECHDKNNIIKIMRYIVFMYDRNSPFGAEKNIIKRKADALIQAGFKVNKDGKFSANVESMMFNSDYLVNKMITRYCRLQRHIEFSALMAYEEKFYSLTQDLRTGTDDEKSKDLIANTDALVTKISQLSNDILSNDTNKELLNALYSALENEQLELTPEDIALKIRNKEIPIDNIWDEK